MSSSKAYQSQDDFKRHNQDSLARRQLKGFSPGGWLRIFIDTIKIVSRQCENVQLLRGVYGSVQSSSSAAAKRVQPSRHISNPCVSVKQMFACEIKKSCVPLKWSLQRPKFQSCGPINDDANRRSNVRHQSVTLHQGSTISVSGIAG